MWMEPVLAEDVIRGRRNPMHFGLSNRLKKARKEAGLSDCRLAELAGISHPVIRHIEDEGTLPRVDFIERIAAALTLSPCYIAFGIEEPLVAGQGMRSAKMAERLKR